MHDLNGKEHLLAALPLEMGPLVLDNDDKDRNKVV